MPLIKLDFTGPLADYAELLRELENHSVRFEIVQQDVDADGIEVRALLNTSDGSHYVEKIVSSFGDRSTVSLTMQSNDE